MSRSQKLTELDNKKTEKVFENSLETDFWHINITNFLSAHWKLDDISKKMLFFIVPSGPCWPLTELPYTEFTNLTELAAIKDRQESLYE